MKNIIVGEERKIETTSVVFIASELSAATGFFCTPFNDGASLMLSVWSYYI